MRLSLRQLRLQLADAALESLDHGLDLPLREPLVDVLGAVDVPGAAEQPRLPDALLAGEDFAEAVRIAQVEFDKHQPLFLLVRYIARRLH
jgi:hypothetical protein